MQGFINTRGQNRQGRAPANSIIQGRGKRVIQYTGNGQGRQQSIKNKETVQGQKNTGKLGNTERINTKTRNKEMAIQ